VKLLEEEGVDFERVNYFVEPFTKERLGALLGSADLTARDVLRTREKTYQEMGLADDSLSESALLDAIVAEPSFTATPNRGAGRSCGFGAPVGECT